MVVCLAGVSPVSQCGGIHDWNALPPRIFDFDDIGKFTDEIQQIYKS